MSHIYTKTGDSGETSLAHGEKVSKSSQRIETLGAIDEFQAYLGFSRALIDYLDFEKILSRMQTILKDAMAQISVSSAFPSIPSSDVQWIEDVIDEYEPAVFSFLTPGQKIHSASLHVARTIARRAERELIRLHKDSPVDRSLLCFINRASDACWVLAFALDQREKNSNAN